jgi:hypothetical protein
VEWLGASPVSADELVARSARRVDNPRDRAAAFLEQFLAAGPRTARDIWKAAQEAGLSARTLQRAKPGLNIRCRRSHADGRPVSYWLLPGQEVTPVGLDPELRRIFADLEKQFPPATPLDEDDLEGPDE